MVEPAPALYKVAHKYLIVHKAFYRVTSTCWRVESLCWVTAVRRMKIQMQQDEGLLD